MPTPKLQTAPAVIRPVRATLQAAIDEFKSISGPITFEADCNDEKLMLVAMYPEPDSLEDAFEDEPWTKFGGDKIIARSGLVQIYSGIDSYVDKFGGPMVSQWVTLGKTSTTADSVLELVGLHDAIYSANSDSYRNDEGAFDFANILLEDCKSSDESPTDQNIIDYTSVCNDAYRVKKFSDEYIDKADGLLEAIDNFENCLAAASPEVRAGFHAKLISDVRAAEEASEQQ